MFIPGWFLNVATIIHSDEALLADGFIFTVHFFNTHLRPEKFPMDIVDLHGADDGGGVAGGQAAGVRSAGEDRHPEGPSRAGDTLRSSSGPSGRSGGRR